MEDTHLYSAEEIETLQKKIATYRETLTALQTGQSVDAPLFTKNEMKSVQVQIAKVDGDMETLLEKQKGPLNLYNQQFEEFSRKIEDLNETVKGLNQELTEVVGKFKKVEGMSSPVITGESAHVQESAKEIEQTEPEFIEEAIQTQERPMTSSNLTHPPTYTQLQRLVEQAFAIQEGSNDEAIVENPPFSREGKKDQSIHNKGFPRVDSSPRQFSIGKYRNVHMQSSDGPHMVEQQGFSPKTHQIAKRHSFRVLSKPVQSDTKEDFSEEDLIRMESIEDTSIETELLEKESIVNESLEEKFVETASSEVKQVTTEIIEEEPMDVESIEKESIEMELLEDESIKGEFIEGNLVEAKLVEEESGGEAAFEADPVVTEPLKEDPVDMELLERKSMETESMEEKQIGMESNEEKLVEDSSETEQLESKQKLTLSLLRFFRKKV